MLQKLNSKPMKQEDFHRCMQAFLDSCKGFPQIEVETKDTLSNGIYTREMFIKKNSLIIGAIHKYESIAILSIGTLKYFSINGLRIIKGHKLIISPAGTQRAGVALTDCVFSTIHRTDKKTIEEALDELIVGGTKSLIGKENNIQLIENRRLDNERNKQLS